MEKKIGMSTKIINLFCQIEVELQEEKKSAKIIKTENYSLRYLKKLKEINDSSLIIDENEKEEIYNNIFMWEYFHIVYLKVNNSKGKDLIELFRSFFNKDEQSLVNLLISGDFQQFPTKLKTDCQNKEIENILQEVVSTFNRRNHFFQIFRYEGIDGIKEENLFKENFEKKKSEFGAILSRYNEIVNQQSIKEDNFLQQLSSCLKCLSGCEEEIFKVHQTNYISIFQSYIIFIDPLLNEAKLENFLDNYITFLQTKEPKDNSSYKSDYSEYEDIESDFFFQIFKAILTNQKKPHDALQLSMNRLKPYFSYHMGELLCFSYQMKTYINKEKTYYSILLDYYLDYLIKEKTSFELFEHYYLIQYDFAHNLQEEFLTNIIFVNLNNEQMVGKLKDNNCLIYFERVLEIALKNQKIIRSFRKEQLLYYLSLVENNKIETDILKYIFNNQLENKVIDNFINEKINVLIQIENFNRILSHSAQLEMNFSIEVVELLKKCRKLNIIFILELLHVFYKAVLNMKKNKIEFELDFENIFQINHIFQLVKLKEKNFNDIQKYKSIFDNMNELLINLM